MKRVLSIMLAVMLLAALCACGGSTESAAPESAEPAESEAPAESEEPAATPATESAAPVETEAPSEPEAPAESAEPAATPAPETEAPVETAAPAESAMSPEEQKNAAMGFVDASVNDLYAAVGYPASSDYAPSCIGPGEDGNLYYDGFTVYTYRENGTETVVYVE